MPPKPLCFVLMPFGKKKDPAHPRSPAIDFNAIYDKAIKPGIEDAGLEPIRADQEQALGIIHKPMFERLLLCDFAVADLTIPNANVFYELGVRHATRHNTTLPVFSDRTTLPFDVALLRALPYTLGKNNAFGARQATAFRTKLTDRLKALRALARQGDAEDSPIFQLVETTQQSNLPADTRLRRVQNADTSLFELLQRYGGHAKTDIFREMVSYAEDCRRELEAARALPSGQARAALDAIRDTLQLDAAEAGVIVDLYLSYRAIKAWDRMVTLYNAMPLVLKRSVLVREQLAFALNRLSREPGNAAYRERAITLLTEVTKQIGPSSETSGLLGRIYKDSWQDARKNGAEAEAHGFLVKAIDAYASGFEADWRDAYPGINATTLLDIEGSADSDRRKCEILPVVRYAVERRIAGGAPDYWDYATLLELAVLDGKPDDANRQLALALAHVRETWEPRTTADNLSYIREARAARGADVAWLDAIIDTLVKKSG